MNNTEFKKRIEIAQSQVRFSKDKLKAFIKNNTQERSLPDLSMIMPPLTFRPTKDVQADQWFANGFILKYKNDLIIIDPGVDFHSRFTTMGFNILDIKAIIVTHNHIDHADDLNIFLSKILKYESSVFDLVVTRFHYDHEFKPNLREKMEKSEHVRLTIFDASEGQSEIVLTNGLLLRLLPLFHTAQDTFGFKLSTNGISVGYISDTGYAQIVTTDEGDFEPQATKGNFVQIKEKHQYIKEFFADCEYTIVNINDIAYNRHSKYHLSGYDVLDILKDSACHQLILQHLNVINADGEDSNYLYKLFFAEENYAVRLPHYCGFIQPLNI